MEQLKALWASGDGVGLFKLLMVPLAFIVGMMKAYNEQQKMNEKLQDAYTEVDNHPITDDDVDKRLDDGTL